MNESESGDFTEAYAHLDFWDDADPFDLSDSWGLLSISFRYRVG